MRSFFLYLVFLTVPSLAMEGTAPLKTVDWSFNGIFGTFDRASLQRGFQVYKEVCASCHSMKLLSYRNLEGIGYTPNQVKAIAQTYEVQDGPNDDGEMFMRPGKPKDRFFQPYANDQAARAANNGALPPDLSLITKAREGGADYVYSLLTGYAEAPVNEKPMVGLYYNPYFSAHWIAMIPPLSDDMIEYQDGTPATVDQMAQDVTTFLAWASEPEIEVRKQWGFRIIIFLFIFSIVMFFINARIWARLEK